MQRLSRLIGKILIAAFVLWHAFSVAVYTVPREAKDPFATIMRDRLLRIVSPYMLITSQWQLWNLFAPDPMRRVTFYTVQIRRGERWERLASIRPGTFSGLRHATQFKMLGNTLEENNEGKKPLVDSYLQYLCKRHRLDAGTPIILVYEFYIIPYNNRRQSVAWWRQWEPSLSSQVGHSTSCLPYDHS